MSPLTQDVFQQEIVDVMRKLRHYIAPDCAGTKPELQGEDWFRVIRFMKDGKKVLEVFVIYDPEKKKIMISYATMKDIFQRVTIGHLLRLLDEAGLTLAIRSDSYWNPKKDLLEAELRYD